MIWFYDVKSTIALSLCSKELRNNKYVCRLIGCKTWVDYSFDFLLFCTKNGGIPEFLKNIRNIKISSYSFEVLKDFYKIVRLTVFVGKRESIVSSVNLEYCKKLTIVADPRIRVPNCGDQVFIALRTCMKYLKLERLDKVVFDTAGDDNGIMDMCDVDNIFSHPTMKTLIIDNRKVDINGLKQAFFNMEVNEEDDEQEPFRYATLCWYKSIHSLMFAVDWRDEE